MSLSFVPNPSNNSIVDAAATRFFDPQHPWTYWSGPVDQGGPFYLGGSTTFTGTSVNGAVREGPGIDCSNLVQQTMLASGYNVGYLNTSAMNDILNGASSSYYQSITGQKGSASQLNSQSHATSPTH